MSEIFEVSEEWVLSEEWVRHSIDQKSRARLLCSVFSNRAAAAAVQNITFVDLKTVNWRKIKAKQLNWVVQVKDLLLTEIQILVLTCAALRVKNGWRTQEESIRGKVVEGNSLDR
jgi:hypothetical protein